MDVMLFMGFILLLILFVVVVVVASTSASVGAFIHEDEE